MTLTAVAAARTRKVICLSSDRPFVTTGASCRFQVPGTDSRRPRGCRYRCYVTEMLRAPLTDCKSEQPPPSSAQNREARLPVDLPFSREKRSMLISCPIWSKRKFIGRVVVVAALAIGDQRGHQAARRRARSCTGSRWSRRPCRSPAGWTCRRSGSSRSRHRKAPPRPWSGWECPGRHPLCIAHGLRRPLVGEIGAPVAVIDPVMVVAGRILRPDQDVVAALGAAVAGDVAVRDDHAVIVEIEPLGRGHMHHLLPQGARLDGHVAGDARHLVEPTARRARPR
jgi:hypothetical protein